MIQCYLCLQPVPSDRPMAVLCDSCRAKRERECAQEHARRLLTADGGARSCYYPHGSATREDHHARLGHCCYCGQVHEMPAAVSA